jgi:hypothetical protein
MKTFFGICGSVALIIAMVLFLYSSLYWANAHNAESIGVGTSTYAAVQWLQVIAVTLFATFCVTVARD